MRDEVVSAIAAPLHFINQEIDMNSIYSVLSSEKPNGRIIRLSELSLMLGVSKTTLWRWRRERRLPMPLSLGPRMIGWRMVDINNWLENIKQEGGVK